MAVDANDPVFGVKAMTKAINDLPPTPTTIRESGLFKAEPMTTTSVEVQVKSDKLILVPAVPRGTPGEPVDDGNASSHIFKALHLPKNDNVYADDVQNVKQFGSNNVADTVPKRINNKLAKMKRDIEVTREHLQLGALQGKLIDAKKNTVLLDIYKEFGFQRKTFEIPTSVETTEVSMLMDDFILEQTQYNGGELIDGWRVYASPGFMKGLKWHKSMKELYKLFNDAKALGSNSRVSFQLGDIEYVFYPHKFNSAADIKDKEALLVPVGTTETFIEYFAPGDFEDAVQTMALPYYALSEPMEFKKGRKLHAQSNPLPIVNRPKLCATLRLT